MIDSQSLMNWKKHAPWAKISQIEQDLIISRALVDIYNHPFLKNALAFRGGTALQKCFFKISTRYSEDLDFVQITKGAIGPIFDALRIALEPWLGKPKTNLSAGRATQIYRYVSTEAAQLGMRLKIEINTTENYNFLGLIEKEFDVQSNWYSGNAKIKTYQLNEILSTKLRALYQRKKGRDLFDMARAIESLPINIDDVLHCFDKYLEQEGAKISRAEFEKNLFLKKDLDMFKHDIDLLLAENIQHDFSKDFNTVMSEIVAKLPGEPWKGVR